jgi:hypothetical protein
VELSSTLLQQLRDRSITHLIVDDPSPTVSPPTVDPSLRSEEIDAELDRMFLEVSKAPMMEQLRESAKRYLKSRLK